MILALYKNNHKKALIRKAADRLAFSWTYHFIGDSDWLSQKSEFLRHCKETPGGFWPLEVIYDNKPQGPTLLNRFADWYYLNCPMARAARERLSAVADWLALRSQEIVKEKGHVRILSLACGGARDAILAFSKKEWSQHVTFLGIDQDERALEHARLHCAEAGLSKFHFVKGNALRPRLGEKDNFDIAVCLGLFDYLSDDMARMVTNRIQKHLDSGGHFLFGMTGTNPSRIFFEKRLNWELRYRQMEEIVAFPQITVFNQHNLLKNCNDCFVLIECKG